MLTIKNIDELVGNTIHTTKAEWVVMDMYERTNDYIIKVRLANSKKPNKVQNFWVNYFWVNFRLLRYNGSVENEWRMYNDQNGDYITLTKGALKLNLFIDILGGQLENV
jgi:hypothetical protein